MTKANRFRFRTWDADSECMVFTDDDTGEYYWCFDEVGMIEAYRIGEPTSDDPEDMGHSERLSDPMQSTGLTDKEGVELFEGDVLRGDLYDARLPTMGAVTWDNENSCWSNQNDAGLTPLRRIDNITVIGNIHENPELMGEA